MSMSKALKSKLAAATKKFKAAKPAASGGMINENVEDGNYTGTLTAAEVVEQAGKGAVLFTYALDMEGGEKEEVKSRYWLETDQNLAYLKRDLARFGFENLDDLDLSEDLEGMLEQLVGMEPICRLSVKTNDQWQNVYLNKVVEVSEPEGEDDEEEETEEETEEEITVGDAVIYKKKEAVVLAVNAGERTLTLKTPDKKKHAGVSFDDVELVEPEEEEEEEEEEIEEELAELAAGSEVVVSWKGKEEPGVVKSISEDEEKVTVKLTALKKVVVVDIDKIEMAE